METHELNVTGKFYLPVVASLPANNASYARQFVYDLATGRIYFHDTSEWKQVLVSEDVPAGFTLHVIDTTNPHSVTADQTGAFVSLGGVSNPGGNIELVNGSGITIDADDTNNRITISSPGNIAAHLVDYNNPHQVNATQLGAMTTLANVGAGIGIFKDKANPTTGNVKSFSQGTNIQIVDGVNDITINNIAPSNSSVYLCGFSSGGQNLTGSQTFTTVVSNSVTLSGITSLIAHDHDITGGSPETGYGFVWNTNQGLVTVNLIQQGVSYTGNGSITLAGANITSSNTTFKVITNGSVNASFSGYCLLHRV